jgi:uncharacterized protein YgfB (UPF0149 family)
MESTAADKRTFYLMMSATQGQEFANGMGFQTPSEDVQEMEIMDVMSRWMLLARLGIFQDVMESADWFIEFLVQNDKIMSPPEEFHNALTVFGVAMANKLMDKNFIGLVIPDDLAEELQQYE